MARDVVKPTGGFRVNVGCGATPTPGYLNFDNSLSLLIGRAPLGGLLLRYLEGGRRSAMVDAPSRGVRWADVTQGLPVPDGSAEVVYSSHMIEHLAGRDVLTFLGECKRVLRSGGVLRLAVPDLRKMAEEYVISGDADRFITQTGLCMGPSSTRSIIGKLRYLLVGNRGHKWMYDGTSLSMLLLRSGFIDPLVLPPGETRIPDPGTLNLRERENSSVYAEAIRP